MGEKGSIYKLWGEKACWENQKEPHTSLFCCLDDACGFLVYPEGEMFTLVRDNERLASISREVMKAEVKGDQEGISVTSSQEQRL